MSELLLKQATLNQLNEVINIYNTLLDSNPDYEKTLRWKKIIYPSFQDISLYIDRKEMYLIEEHQDIVGVVVLTSLQGDAYRDIDWLVPLDDNDVIVIHLFALLPTCQGKGYARKSLESIVSYLKKQSKKSIRLDAISTNEHAQRLYEKFGFIKCGEAKLYYESTGLTDFIFYEYIIK